MIHARHLLISLVIASAVVLADDDESCDFDKAEMLALDQRDFDQDPVGGWRIVARNSKCRIAAADLIRSYIDENGERGVIMTWHEGQMRAMAGQVTEAIALFEASRKPGENDRIGWNYYVDASVAFLAGDENRLREAREELSALPRPDNYNPVDSFGNPVKVIWPPNLNVVDGLLKCFGESYDYAYNNCSTSFAAVSERK